jgi:licheninase
MRISSIILAFLLFGCDSSVSQDDPQNEQPGDIEGWTLVWNDEFDGEGLPDPSKWSYNVGGHGWGNNELQYYTENRIRNARLENGNLVIEAVKEPFEGSDYTSARLVTKGKGDWTYGRFEIRAKLPSGRGTWPAIWMLASQNEYGDGYWPDNGEIDIMEHVGYDPDVVHSTVHTLAYNHRQGTQVGDQINVPTARSGFNVYRVDWGEGVITAYVNDELYFHFRNERLTDPNAGFAEWPFDKPFHLLLNIAVGGDWGGAQGVDESIWPQRMEVDYVRVYEKAAD